MTIIPTTHFFGVTTVGDGRKPSQSFLDYQTIRFIAEHGALVVLNTWPELKEPPLPEGEDEAPLIKNWGRRDNDIQRVVRESSPKLVEILHGSEVYITRPYGAGSS